MARTLAQRVICALAGFAVAMLGKAEPALAHTSERGHVMLLPTGYYLAGGAIAVALSFLILALARPAALDRLSHWQLQLVEASFRGRALTSTVSFMLLVVLIAAGFWGSRDPLSNPLPLTIWTLCWVGLTLLQGVFGNLWSWINPWYGPYLAATALRRGGPRFHLSVRVGYWPAIVIFLAFAWFELIYPAPDDPWRLALVVATYWLASFAAMLLFGYAEWTRRGEIFSVFFGMIARLSVFDASPSPKGYQLSLCLPGARLIAAPVLPLSGVLFLLLALSSVSFDGLMRTFFWLGINGINPLEFPGRSAVMGINSAGLHLMFVALTAGFLTAVFAGNKLAGNGLRLPHGAGALVWSIIPISLAYHFSHYLTALMVNGQYALAAMSDPFSIGWNLFGTAQNQIHAGIAAGHEGAWTIWNAQAAAIIGGHVLAVITAHAIAWRLHGSRRQAVLSQAPLGLLMVGYTVFGLWLLSTPTAG